MGDDERLMQEHGRSVVAAARELQARRARVVAEARAERRRGRRLRDVAVAARDRHLDLSWRLWSLTGCRGRPPPFPFPGTCPEPRRSGSKPHAWPQRNAPRRARQRCRVRDGEERRTLASISGVAAYAADFGRVGDPDSRRALSLCVRVIESNSILLDGLGSTTGGALAASSTRRCAEECTRALAASYLEAEG